MNKTLTHFCRTVPDRLPVVATQKNVVTKTEETEETAEVAETAETVETLEEDLAAGLEDSRETSTRLLHSMIETTPTLCSLVTYHSHCNGNN